jgi:aminopeptidase N
VFTRIVTVAILMTLSAGQSRAQEPVAPGVPFTLAQQRAQQLKNIQYRLHIAVPAAPQTPVTGSAVIAFTLSDTTRPVILDFAGPADSITEVRVGLQAVPLVVRNEHIEIPAAALKVGINEIRLSFVSSDLALNRNPEFMYTLFVPARARYVFPCFDQPDLKAMFSLTLDVPDGWKTLTNGAEHTRETRGSVTRIRFGETQPIPTYLFAFAAGRFQEETATRNGRTFTMLHRETDAAKVARNRDAIFDLHASAIDWLERYTGIPYPFRKFDFLLVPSFQFGGMEHPGSIFYNAASLFLDPSATTNQKLGRASLIAHETSHMWFGDLVTMRWFDDVWMKEVFANFMAAKIVNPSFPEINHELRFLYSHYPAAYDVDRTAGTNAIRQRLDNLNEAGSLYGAIIYQKAPIVMRQLEMIVTPDGLRDGLREYLKQHSFGNASWPDLIALLDRRTPDDLAAWSRAWVEEAGRPIVETQANGGTLAFRQQDPSAERGLHWAQRLQVAIGSDGKADVRDVALRAEPVTTAKGVAAERYDYILPTGGGIGYGDFVLDDRTRTYLLDHLADLPEPLTRGAALVTLWEEMLDGRVPPARLFATLTTALPRERDELSVQRLLSYTQELYWKFLDAAARQREAPGLEQLLRTGLAAAASQSTKSAWFNTLRDVAQTSATVAWLERVWKTTDTVPGLTLAEPDFITLALELALREPAGWQQILEEQSKRIQNPDRKAQFEFVRPALDARPATRDAFFERLREVKNRGREAWVLQGLDYLHHPLRAASAEKYIRPSLDLLREIQRTGDIFFPKRWMDATLSGHQSASAAHVVSEFLENVPKEYPERLRRVILSSADDLLRARRIRER